MKKSIFTAFLIALTVFIFTAATCFSQSGGSGGGIILNSPDDLKAYLDSQPANSLDKPIKVSMAANAQMFPKIKDVLNDADKYVSLNLTGTALTTIPKYAFSDYGYGDGYDEEPIKGCETLVSITIPNSVTSIGMCAFSFCKNLTSVTIPNSVTGIGGGAFGGCTSLTSITIPNSVTSIGGGAFYGCANLTNITIPNIRKTARFT